MTRKRPSEEALKNAYEAMKPCLIRIAKEIRAKREAEKSLLKNNNKGDANND